MAVSYTSLHQHTPTGSAGREVLQVRVVTWGLRRRPLFAGRARRRRTRNRLGIRRGPTLSSRAIARAPRVSYIINSLRPFTHGIPVEPVEREPHFGARRGAGGSRGSRAQSPSAVSARERRGEVSRMGFNRRRKIPSGRLRG